MLISPSLASLMSESNMIIVRPALGSPCSSYDDGVLIIVIMKISGIKVK